MPPKSKKAKDKESKKSQQKKKEKIIEDKTFGLKNKNKSRVVQAKIRSIERNVLNSGDPKQRKLDEQRKKAKADAKARKKAMEEERNALFGEALLAVQKKGKNTNQKGGRVEAKGRDGNDDGKGKGTSRAMKMMFQMDAKEMAERLREDPNYVPTLEDEIEAQRQKKVEELKRTGKGTKVTEETFRAWQERKRKRRAAAAKKLVEAEMKKKKGGKGLAILSGRDLFEYKRDLFVDDDGSAAPTTTQQQEAPRPEGEQASKQQQQQGEDQVEKVASEVQENLFLEGDDDDLDDLDDLDED